ncbi:MAG: TetR/AcrR family transcriptional regulator [Streptosporangiaceae bacterium]
MPYRRSPQVAARLARSRERAVEVAVDLVADHGWSAASVTAIAAAAGMSVGAMYRYFPSKSDLLVEVFRRVASREVAVLEDVVRPEAETAQPATGLLRQAVSLFARRALDRPALAFALLAEPADPAVEAERLEYRRRFRGVFASVVRAGAARGEFPVQDADLTAAAVVGAISEILVGPLSHARGREPDPDLISQICVLALRCAGADGTGPGGAPRAGSLPARGRQVTGERGTELNPG